MDAFPQMIIDKIEPLSQAKIIFIGFRLPESFGGGSELEFGNAEETVKLGLSPGASEMAKEFVKTAIEDLFSEDSEIEQSEFSFSENGATFTITALD